jgi:hypothetical protein
MKTKKTEQMKTRKFTKKQVAMLAGVVSIGFVGMNTASARGAFDLGSFVLSSTGLNDNQIVKDVMAFYNNLGNVFSAGIQDYTTITQQAIDQVRGVQGQFAPTDTKKEIDQKADPNNPLSLNTKIGTAAWATNDLAAQQVLSKPGQEGIKAANEKMKTIEQLTTNLSDNVFYAGVDAQSFSSSQDVLKTISIQLSGQADIAAAQVRLSVVQNSSMQDLKMNAAALNVAAASQLERDLGKNQAEKIDKWNDYSAHTNAVWRNMLLPTQ